MAHELVEVATFTPTVTVPDGTDSRSNAAEVVQGIAQALANRTRALKAVTDSAAVKNQPNTFTQANTFNALLRANNGIGAADGSVEIVDSLKIAGGVDITGDCWVHTPHLWLEEGVDIVYSTISPHAQPQRLVQLDISRARITSGNPQWDDFGGFWYTTGSASKLEVPIILPRSTAQWSFQVVWSCDGVSGSAVAEAWRWGRDYSLTGYNAQSDGDPLGSVTLLDYSSTTGDGFVSSGPIVTEEVDPSNSRLAVIVSLPAGANNRLYGLRVQFWDPGARNG